MSKFSTLLGPIILFSIYVAIFVFVRGKIPEPAILLKTLENLYASFGYIIVLGAAFIESLFPIGFYVPGSTAILLGAALAKTGVLELPIVILLGTLGLLTGYTANYIVGRHGWYHILARFGFEKGIHIAEKKIKTHGGKAMFVGYFLPSSASLISTAAGVLRMPFYQFILISTVSQSFWSILWGTLTYLIGLALVEFSIRYFGIVVLVVLCIWIRSIYVRKVT